MAIDIEPTKTELTIREMAQQSGLSEHTLRYYERIGLIMPIPRDASSGHRRYSADTIGLVESLACLRGTGMSIEDMRHYLVLRDQGSSAATEQKVLFASHKETLEKELMMFKLRLEYLDGKVAYWEAIEQGDMKKAERIGVQNKQIAKKLQ